MDVKKRTQIGKRVPREIVVQFVEANLDEIVVIFLTIL